MRFVRAPHLEASSPHPGESAVTLVCRSSRSSWFPWRWPSRTCRRRLRSWPSPPRRTLQTPRCCRWCCRAAWAPPSTRYSFKAGRMLVCLSPQVAKEAGICILPGPPLHMETQPQCLPVRLYSQQTDGMFPGRCRLNWRRLVHTPRLYWRIAALSST